MKRERGQALLIVLALLGVGAVLIVPFLQMASTAAKGRQIYGQVIKEDFAADAAVDYGLWRLKYESGFAANLPSGVESPPFYITLNGVEASTTVMAQVQSGALSGQALAGRAQDEVYKVTKTVVATSTYATFAADGFETGTGSGGTGTWLAGWTLSGDYQFSTSGSYEGTYHLRLIGDDNSSPADGSAQRRVNLSGTTGLGPFLNFWAKVESFESGDTAQLKVSTNGSTWDVLKTFSSFDSSNQWRFYQYDISAYGRPADFYVVFAGNMSSNHDYLHVDALSVSSSDEATTIQPGVVTDYTYYITIECLDPNGGNALNNRNLDRIIDKLPNRNATSGDYLQYIPGSTQWDSAEWGLPPFDPTTINSVGGSGTTTRHQELEWDFEDAGYEDVDFAYGDIKTLSFKARAALTEGVYGNRIDISVRSGSDSDIAGGATAKFVVGNPADTRLSGGLLDVTKTVTPLVLYPNEPTTLTYTINIENVDTIPVRIYEVDDWLPSTGSASSNESFVYVPHSTNGTIIGRSASPDVFYDGFSRADSNTVSHWTDSDGSGGNVAINNNSVRLTTGAPYNHDFNADGSTVPAVSSIGDMNNATRKTGVRFTAQSNQTVTKIRVYLEKENGTSPGYRYGLQADSGGNPSGSYLGYGDFTATTTGWQTITLGSGVSLSTGTVYHIVVQPTGSPANPTGTNYVALRRTRPQNKILPYDGAADPQSNTEFYTGSWATQDFQPLYVLETATPTYEGNPVETTTDQGVYSTNYAAEKLTITGGTKLVTGIGFYVKRNNNTPSGDLLYEIRDSANTVVRSGTLAVRTSVTGSYQWYDVALSSSLSMTDGATYKIDLYTSSTLASGNYYQVLRNDNNNSAAYNVINYRGTGSVYSSSPNGSAWTDSSQYDIPFHLTYVAEFSITQSNISTAGFTDIALSYDYWRGVSGGTDPQLRVEWKPTSNGTWNTLGTHTLTSTGPTTQSWNLPAQANDTNIDIRFTDLAVSTPEARVDSVKITSSVPVSYTRVGMPDSNNGADFFTQTWQNAASYRRWELNWSFGDYPAQDDPVWDEGGECEGIFWADYDPYLELQPGETFRVVFQASVTLTASGSYYNEVFVRIPDQGGGRNWMFSWPTGEVSVPQYDLQAQTLNSILRANAMLTSDGHWWRSWHWRRHK